MKSFKPITLGFFGVLISFGLVSGYDYFYGHKIITNKSVVLSPAQVSAITSTATNVVETVTYPNVNGTSSIRQLVKSPVEVSYSSDDKTPLTVSTGKDGSNATYLAKFNNYSLDRENTMVMSVSNTGDLVTDGKVDAGKGTFDSVATDKVSLDGILKFKSKEKDPTKSGSSDKKKYGLLWLDNDGNDLNFMNSSDSTFTFLKANSNGKVGIGTNDPLYALHVANGAIFASNSNGDTGIYMVGSATGSYSALQAVNAANTSTKNLVLQRFGGSVGIGLTSPTAKLDILGADDTVLLKMSDSLADNTEKDISFGAAHYTNSEKPFGFFLVSSLNSNHIKVGGGTAAMNAATQISFYTATDNTTSVGTQRMLINAAGNVGIGTTAPSQLLDVNGDTIRIRDDKTPTSSSASCAKGEVVWDANYVYVCVATDSWKRSALATW